MKNNNAERPSHWKYKIAAFILLPLFIASFIIIVSPQTSMYSQPRGFDFRQVLTKLVDIFKGYNTSFDKVQFDSTRVKMTPIESAIDAYHLNTGQYPSALNDLIVDPKIPGWAGPYLKQSQVFDTWNRSFIYIQTGTSYTLISLGADGKPGGEGYNADVYNN